MHLSEAYTSSPQRAHFVSSPRSAIEEKNEFNENLGRFNLKKKELGLEGNYLLFGAKI